MENSNFNIQRSNGPDRVSKSNAEFNVDPAMFGEALAEALVQEESAEKVNLGAGVTEVREETTHRPPIEDLNKPLSNGDIKDLFHMVNTEMERAGLLR